MIPDYPSNSDTSKKKPAEEKDIKRVTSEEPIRRRRPLRKRLSETFVAGDAKSAIDYVVFDVLIPAARDMIVDAGQEGIRSLVLGVSRRRGGSVPPNAGPTGHVSYNRYSMGASRQTAPQRVMSRQARAKHNFDEIVIPERVEAERVIDEIFEIVSQYGTASVADLYELVGIASSHTDNKWGWDDLRGSGVSRVRGGFLLDLPEPQPLG